MKIFFLSIQDKSAFTHTEYPKNYYVTSYKNSFEGDRKPFIYRILENTKTFLLLLKLKLFVQSVCLSPGPINQF